MIRRLSIALAALLLHQGVIPTVMAAGTQSVVPANTVMCNPGPSAAAPTPCSSLPSGMTVPPGVLPTPTPTTLGGVESKAAVSHQFLTQIGTDGSVSAAQPAASDVSGLATSATTDATNASNISSGTLAAARGGAGTITGALKANGSGVVSQAACADLSNAAASCSTDATNASNISSGTLAAARLPNPSATTLGGVQSKAFVASQFLTSISTSGVPGATQPACADLSDSSPSCSSDATNASNIGSGTLADGRLSANVPLLNAASNTFTGPITAGSINVTSSTIPANGCYLSGTNAIACSTNSTQRITIGSNGVLQTLYGNRDAIRVITASGSVTVTTSDRHVCVNKTTGAATTVNLFSSPGSGTVITVDDCKGDAATNNITVTPAAGNIDGSGTFVINTNYGSWTGVYTGSIWKTESAR